MAEENARLNVEIRQKSTGTGIADTTRDLKGLAAAETAAGKAAQATAKSVNDLGEASDKGAAAGRILTSALGGNLAALAQLGPLLKGIGTLLKTNIIGLLVTLGSMAASFSIPFIEGWTKTKDAAKEAADEMKRTEQATKDAEKAADELGKTQMEVLIQNLEIIRKTATEADDAFKSMQGRAQQLDDAQRTLELTKIAADKNLTEEQKVVKAAGVNERYDTRRGRRGLDELRERVANAADARGGASGQEIQANDQLKSARSRVDEISRERSALEAEQARLRAKYNARQEEILRTTNAGSERNFLMKQNRDETVAAATPGSQRLGLLNGPAGKAREVQAQTALAEAEKRAAAATAARQKTDEDLRKLEKELDAASEQVAKLIPIITETGRIKTAQDVAAARVRDIAAGRTVNVTPSTPAAVSTPRATVTMGDGSAVDMNDPETAARQRAAALATVAGGEAAQVANNVKNAPELQGLGLRAKDAADAAAKNPTLENIAKLIELMTALNNGQTALTARLKTLETQIKTNRTR